MAGVPTQYLVYQASEEQPNLHEHEVGSGVKICEAEEGEIVVEAVEGGRHEVEQENPPVFVNTFEQRPNTRTANNQIPECVDQCYSWLTP